MKTLTDHELNMALWKHHGYTNIRPKEPEDDHRPGRGWTGIPTSTDRQCGESDRESLFDFAYDSPGARDHLSTVLGYFTDEQKLEYIKTLYLLIGGGVLTQEDMASTHYAIGWWEMLCMVEAGSRTRLQAILRTLNPELFK
jgi:hypothetical protein